MHFRMTTSQRYTSRWGSGGIAHALLNQHINTFTVSPHHLYEQTRASTTKYARFRCGLQAIKAPEISQYGTLSNHHAAVLHLLIKALLSAGHGAHRSSSGKSRISKEREGFGVWKALWQATERGRSSGSKKCVSHDSSITPTFNLCVFASFNLCVFATVGNSPTHQPNASPSFVLIYPISVSSPCDHGHAFTKMSQKD